MLFGNKAKTLDIEVKYRRPDGSDKTLQTAVPCPGLSSRLHKAYDGVSGRAF
jgi:hypothetical protein